MILMQGEPSPTHPRYPLSPLGSGRPLLRIDFQKNQFSKNGQRFMPKMEENPPTYPLEPPWGGGVGGPTQSAAPNLLKIPDPKRNSAQT